ncbi:MAG: AMP-binding protein [Gaiellales bacterium]|nr:AMP-binding protein [Gaiellales bacterium]
MTASREAARPAASPAAPGIVPDPARERTIHALLKRRVAEHGNREYFTFRERVYGYEDLDRESDRVAAGLQKLGVKKGDFVAIEMKNRPEFIFIWFGLSKLGAVEVPLNTAHRGDLLAYMINKPECRLLITESDWLDRVAPVLDDTGVEQVIVLGREGEELPGLSRPTLDYRALVDNDGAYQEIDVFWSDPFAIIFTSGTTGPSKGSLMPQNYALFMGEICTECAEYTEADRLYNALPLFHGNAQLLSTMAALVSGARMVLAERFSASRFWDDIKRHGCTEFNYIGGILPILLKAEPRPDDADNPVRVMVGGGCPPDLFDLFERRFGVVLLEGYGMSELGLPLMNTLKHGRKGTIGRPVYGCEVKVVDDHDSEVAAGVMGEMLVRTQKPYTMLLEYYKDPQKTVEAWRDLWFHTGDYGVKDEEGYFHYKDRKKDALRRRGENISSYEVERIINSHPAVLESAAVPVKSPESEDEVMVCLSLKPAASLAPVELMDYVQDKMAYFMMPRYLRIMEELPHTPTAKIQKQELRDEGVTADTWDRETAGYQVKR